MLLPSGPYPVQLTDDVIEAAVRACPDKCAPTVGDLAERIGIDKLVLITWARSDRRCALLIAAKMTS